MPIERIEIEGLDEIRSRFANFPRTFRRIVKETMQASLLKIWQNIPPYPPTLPNQRYIRTGTLGRSLGSGEGGGRQQGKPDIYEVTQNSRYTSGSFGTRLGYAPEVIGERQRPIHQGRWYTLKGSVLKAVLPKIEKLWQSAADRMAKWLDGRNL